MITEAFRSLTLHPFGNGAALWPIGTQQIIHFKTNGTGEGREMDFIESLGEIDQHQPGQDDNYMLIVLQPHFAFPFNQM